MVMRVPMLMRATCILACVWLAGCATLEHSFSIAEYAGRTLSTRGGDGAIRLEAELEVDTALRDFVAANGRPDYLHVVDRMGLYFFYVADDRAVKFERDFVPPSVARDLGRIPGSLLRMLPKREVDAIVARRSAAKRRDAARQTRRHRAPPASAPAAPARSGGYVSLGFDVKTIVERLRPPLTAADPGVSGWRVVRFSDGEAGSTAAHGRNLYEVRRDRLVLAMAISATRSAPPAGARFEVQRLNGTVFGAHATVVTEQVMAFMKRVSADRTGRTPIAQRIRGRTVRVDRVPKTGLLVYSIRP